MKFSFIQFLAVLVRGLGFLEFIKNHELYSLLYLKRRAENTRGSPVRAALLWAMLEEARIYTENHFNLNQRTDDRPLRQAVHSITGMICISKCLSLVIYFVLEQFEILDADFQVRSVEPLLPINPLWKENVGDSVHVGLLVECHTIGCRTERIQLSRCWWPLTSASASRMLNVSRRQTDKKRW